MFRTIWDWLEIDETRDKALIRKAYARQAKKYHPEDTPEEARQLREAYKRALALAAEDEDTGFTGHESREEAPDDNIGNGCNSEQGQGTETQKVLPDDTEIIYRYNFGDQEKKHIYPKSAANFDYFHFDESRTKRLGRLEERLNSLYHNKAFQNPDLWSDAIRKFLVEEDLRDARVISAVLSILTRVPGLGRPLWDAFEKELFCHCGDGAEWTWLRSQFVKMRREDSIYLEVQKNAQAASRKAAAGQTAPSAGEIIPEKTAPKGDSSDVNVVLMIMLIIVCCFVYFFMFYLLDVILW